MTSTQLLAPLRALVATACLGTAFATHAVLSYHYFSTARGLASENLQLKENVRGLVERMAEVEGSMSQVAAAGRSLNAVTLTEFKTVVDRAGLDATPAGPFSQALGGMSETSTARSRSSLRRGTVYASLLDRLASARHRADQLTESLGEAAASLSHRQHVLRSLPSILPARGWVSSEFGMRESPFHRGFQNMHNGIDIAAMAGSPVVATADGVVDFAGNYGGYGKLVIVKHGFGITTRYAHNTELLVRKGDTVQRGQAVATVGSTGRSTGAHVHYEVLIHGVAVDPRRFLFGEAPAEEEPRDVPLASLVAMGGETDGDAAASFGEDPLIDVPRAFGIEWDAKVFALSDGILLHAAPRFWREATTADMAFATLALILAAIASLVVRLPRIELRAADEASPYNDPDETLSPAELVRRYQRRQQPRMPWHRKVQQILWGQTAP